jgi:biopolymer transport protein ExbB/TolQ
VTLIIVNIVVMWIIIIMLVYKLVDLEGDIDQLKKGNKYEGNR